MTCLERVSSGIAFGFDALQYCKLSTRRDGQPDGLDGRLSPGNWENVYVMKLERKTNVIIYREIRVSNREITVTEKSNSATPTELPHSSESPVPVLKGNKLSRMRKFILGPRKTSRNQHAIELQKQITVDEEKPEFGKVCTQVQPEHHDVKRQHFGPLSSFLPPRSKPKSPNTPAASGKQQHAILKRMLDYPQDSDSSNPWNNIDPLVRKAVLEDVIQIALATPPTENDGKDCQKNSTKKLQAETEQSSAQRKPESKDASKNLDVSKHDFNFTEGLTNSVKSKFSAKDVPHGRAAEVPNSEDPNLTNSSLMSPEHQLPQECLSSTLEAISRVFHLPADEMTVLCQDAFYRKLYSHCAEVTIIGATGLSLEGTANCEVRCVVSIACGASNAPSEDACSVVSDSSAAAADAGTSQKKDKSSIIDLRNRFRRRSSKSLMPLGDTPARSATAVEDTILSKCSTTPVSLCFTGDSASCEWNESFIGFCSEIEKIFLRFDILESSDDNFSLKSVGRQSESSQNTAEDPIIGTASIPISTMGRECTSISLPLVPSLEDSCFSSEVLSLTSLQSPDAENSASKFVFPPSSGNEETPDHKGPNLKKSKKIFTKPLKKIAQFRKSHVTKKSLSPAEKESAHRNKVDEVTEKCLLDSHGKEEGAMRNPNDFGSVSTQKLETVEENLPESDLDHLSTKSLPLNGGRSRGDSSCATLMLSCSINENHLLKELHSSTPRIVLSFIISTEIRDRSRTTLSTPFSGVVSPPLQPLLERLKISSKLPKHQWARMQLQALLEQLNPPSMREKKSRNTYSLNMNSGTKPRRKDLQIDQGSSSGFSDVKEKKKISKIELWYKDAGRLVDFELILRLLQDLKSDLSFYQEDADVKLFTDWLELCLKILEGFHTAFPVLDLDIASFQLENFTKLLSYLVTTTDGIERNGKFRPLRMMGFGLSGSERKVTGLNDSRQQCSVIETKADLSLPNNKEQEGESKALRTSGSDQLNCNEYYFSTNCSKERLTKALTALQQAWWHGTLSVERSLASSFSGTITTTPAMKDARRDAVGDSAASAGSKDQETAAELLHAMEAVASNVWRYLVEMAECVSPAFERNLDISLFTISSEVLTQNLITWLQEQLKKLYITVGISTECFSADVAASSRVKSFLARRARQDIKNNNDASQALLYSESTLRSIYMTVREICRLTVKKASDVSSFPSLDSKREPGMHIHIPSVSYQLPSRELFVEETKNQSAFPSPRAKTPHSILRTTETSSLTKNKGLGDSNKSSMSLLKKWLRPLVIRTIKTCAERAENYLVLDELKDELNRDCLMNVRAPEILDGINMDQTDEANCGSRQIAEGRTDDRLNRRKIMISTSASSLRDTAVILSEYWVSLDWEDLHYNAHIAEQNTRHQTLEAGGRFSSDEPDAGTGSQSSQLKQKGPTPDDNLLRRCKNSVKGNNYLKHRASFRRHARKISSHREKFRAKLATIKKVVSSPLSTANNIVGLSGLCTRDTNSPKLDHVKEIGSDVQKISISYKQSVLFSNVKKLVAFGNSAKKKFPNSRRSLKCHSDFGIPGTISFTPDNDFRFAQISEADEDSDRLSPLLQSSPSVVAEKGLEKIQPVFCAGQDNSLPPTRELEDPNVIFVTELCKLCTRFSTRQYHRLQKLLSSKSWKDVTCVEKVCVGLNNISEASEIVGQLPKVLKLDDATTAAVTSKSFNSIHLIGCEIMKQILQHHYESIHGSVVKCCGERSLVAFRMSLLQRDYPILKELLCARFWLYYQTRLSPMVNRAIAKEEVRDLQNPLRLMTLAALRREFFELIGEDES